MPRSSKAEALVFDLRAGIYHTGVQVHVKTSVLSKIRARRR
ncbi:MAG TPA: hypothetical protein VHQ44_10920 [Thermoanaerobaculia bacterium]|nr:hypothetical protein [Thermoanaerobaculia bacterium]